MSNIINCLPTRLPWPFPQPKGEPQQPRPWCGTPPVGDTLIGRVPRPPAAGASLLINDNCGMLRAMAGPLSPGPLTPPTPPVFNPPPPPPTWAPPSKQEVYSVTDGVADAAVTTTCAAVGAVVIPGPVGAVVGAGVGVAVVGIGRWLRGR